jgi:Flp pilus assembly protein TadD
MTHAAAETKISAAAKLINAGSLSSAERLLKDVLAIEPDHARGHALMALILYRRDRPAAAVRQADVAIGLDPTEEAFRFKALALIKLGRQNSAMDAAAAAARAAPLSGSAASVQAIAFESARRPAEAEAAFRRAVSLDPASLSVRASLGRFLLRRGDRRGAERVAQDLPPDADAEVAILLRGELALASGKGLDARDCALMVLRQDATNRAALRLLTQVKASQSPLLGLWWRWSVFIGSKRPWIRLLIVPPAVLAATLVPFGLGLWLLAYLAICRRVFQHMLARELRIPRLRADF